METQRSLKLFLGPEWPLEGFRGPEFLFLFKSQIWTFCSSSPYLEVNKITQNHAHANIHRVRDSRSTRNFFLETAWPLGVFPWSKFFWLIKTQFWSCLWSNLHSTCTHSSTTPRSQIGTVVYVRSHNFFISDVISTVLSVLERRDTVLSNAPKIIEIGWEITKLWSQTYATVQNLMI